MTDLYVDWEGLTRNNEDAPMVRVYFKAGGYQPYVPATWEQPAEGGMFEDITFLRAEIDPRDLPCDPLTEAEIVQAKAWFETGAAQEEAQDSALYELDGEAWHE